MTVDPHETLGLTKSATPDDIKKAYRKLVRTSHPDLHPDDAGAEARFKAIAAAHDLLKDPETRARFDAGEIDGAGAERPQRQYYRDFAEAGGNPYQQRRGFESHVDPAATACMRNARPANPTSPANGPRGGCWCAISTTMAAFPAARWNAPA